MRTARPGLSGPRARPFSSVRDCFLPEISPSGPLLPQAGDHCFWAPRGEGGLLVRAVDPQPVGSHGDEVPQMVHDLQVGICCRSAD